MKVLVINCGSSSLKYQLIDSETEQVLAKGSCERIKLDGSLTHQATGKEKIQIEARVLGDLAMNHIIPVATQYQTDLINNVYKMQSLFPAEKAAKLSAKNLELIEEIADRTAFIKEHVDAMIEAHKVANKIESEREKAIAYHDTIVPALEEIRYHIDKLELIVDNQMWTLPKYRELLFVR